VETNAASRRPIPGPLSLLGEQCHFLDSIESDGHQQLGDRRPRPRRQPAISAPPRSIFDKESGLLTSPLIGNKTKQACRAGGPDGETTSSAAVFPCAITADQGHGRALAHAIRHFHGCDHPATGRFSNRCSASSRFDFYRGVRRGRPVAAPGQRQSRRFAISPAATQPPNEPDRTETRGFPARGFHLGRIGPHERTPRLPTVSFRRRSRNPASLHHMARGGKVTMQADVVRTRQGRYTNLIACSRRWTGRQRDLSTSGRQLGAGRSAVSRQWTSTRAGRGTRGRSPWQQGPSQSGARMSRRRRRRSWNFDAESGYVSPPAPQGNALRPRSQERKARHLTQYEASSCARGHGSNSRTRRRP